MPGGHRPLEPAGLPASTPAADAAHPLPGLPRLPAALPRSGVSTEARAALRQVLGDVDRGLAAAFRGGADAGALAGQRARAVARVVAHVWHACVGDGSGCLLLAVGGFGHGLLFPFSDVDLLVLGGEDALARQARALEAFFACLWDVGLKPGQAVRTLAQCRALAERDVGVYTSLLDGRPLAGDAGLLPAFEALRADAALWPPADFLAAKRAEQAARHARFNDTAYNLEPNLKEGPGGLRTLDLVRWLGLRIAGAAGLDAMAGEGLLDATEKAALERARTTLRRCRYALHLAAGRAEERLLFDYQRPLAAGFGYVDEHATNLAVEQFMQAYYRAATIVERLGAQVAERCSERLEGPPGPPRALDRDFVALGERIEPRDPALFRRRPRAIVDLFAVQLDHPDLRGLSAETMRLLQRALARHRGGFAEDPHVLAAFLALLRRGAPAVEALARMNRHGVLAAILPPFRRVVGRMQYDLFHVYTVDEHTLRVLRNVARFAQADPAFPHADEAFAALDRPELLLLAALFHDIAKGRGGDHSALGEEEARAFCRKLGLSGADTDLVAWLVRWHLLMSVTAQRQDITDPDVVHAFAVQVGDRDRLDHLYLLTIADIAGTNPRLWNDWKARLLADLHAAARYVLRAGLGRPPHADERAAECRRGAREQLVRSGMAGARVDALLDLLPEASFRRHRPARIVQQAKALDGASPGAPVIAVEAATTRGDSEIFVCAPDRDGLFAAIAATLDRLGLTVVGARLLRGGDGRVFDTFEVLDAETFAAVGPKRALAIASDLRRVLGAPALAPRPARRSLSRRLRHFQRPPRIAFDAHGAATQLALVCSDRPGLLAQVALAFREAGVRVHDARIATFGERVEDFFLLTDENDAPLDEDRRDGLRAILLRSLGGPTTDEENARDAIG
jgi:[protein-PII] uridylyltransferase